MSVAENNKRVMITLDPRVQEILNELKSQNVKGFKTYSQIINAAVVYMYMVLNGMDEENNERSN